MTNRWKNGWFDVHPRYSCGSPAMVDMRTALMVARHEVDAYPGYLQGIYGKQDQETAQNLGLAGIIEWMQGETLIGYDLLTSKWSVYRSKDATGWYSGCVPSRPRIQVQLFAGSGTKAKYNVFESDGRSILRHSQSLTEIQSFLTDGRYRKAASESLVASYRDLQRELDEALEDAGVNEILRRSRR